MPQGACSLVSIFGGRRVSKLRFPDLNQDGRDDHFQIPTIFARVTGHHQQQPDMLGQLMGGTYETYGWPGRR